MCMGNPAFAAGCALAHILGAGVLIDRLFFGYPVIIGLIAVWTPVVIGEYCFGRNLIQPLAKFFIAPIVPVFWLFQRPMRWVLKKVSVQPSVASKGGLVCQTSESKKGGDSSMDEQWKRAVRTKLFWILLSYVGLTMFGGLVVQAVVGEEKWGYYGIIAAIPGIIWWFALTTGRRY